MMVLRGMGSVGGLVLALLAGQAVEGRVWAETKPIARKVKPAKLAPRTHAKVATPPAAASGDPQAQVPAGNTIPMDFSGMARRGVDLKSPDEESEQARKPHGQPFLRQDSQSGALAPGVQFHF